MLIAVDHSWLEYDILQETQTPRTFAKVARHCADFLFGYIMHFLGNFT